MTNASGESDRSGRSDLDPDLLDAYLAGRCTPADWTRIDRWVNADPSRRALLAGLRRGVTTPVNYPLLPNAARTEETLRAIQQRDIGLRIPSGIASNGDGARTYPSRRSRIARWRAGIGAAAIGAGLLIAIAFRGGFTHPSGGVLSSTRTYATVAGQTATIALRDGSRVTLGPSSLLRITASGAQGGTIATIHGEAFFTIAHHNTAPFVVRAGAAEARVLGTAFSIRHYAGELRARIVVTEGRVSVRAYQSARAAAAPSVLVVNTLAEVDDSGQVRVVPNVSSDEYAGWASGHLVFHGAPLRDVLADLARGYGADIRVADSLLARQPITFSASVNADPLSTVMDLLARAADAHWERVDKAFILTPGRSASATSSPSRFPKRETHYGR